MEVFLKEGDEEPIFLENEKLTTRETNRGAKLSRNKRREWRGINTHLQPTTSAYVAQELSVSITSQLLIQRPKFIWFKAQ